MKFFLLLVVSLCLVHLSYSQEKKVEKDYGVSGVISYLKFSKSVKYPLSQAEQILRDSLPVKGQNSLKLLERRNDQLGFTHLKYLQYYNGFRVEFADYSVHAKGDSIRYISGNYQPIPSIVTVPTLTEQRALSIALKTIGAEKYIWQDSLEEKFLKEINGNTSLTYYPKGELMIMKNIFQTNDTYHLAYRFDIYAKLPQSHKLYYIDAINGTLLYAEELIKHANSTGSADTRYSGNRGMVTDSYSGGYRLRESRNSVQIQTLNMNNGTNYGAATDFSDNDNNWTSAEHNNSAKDNAALDAHWAGEQVYDYFLNIHGRNSWNNAGGSILNYVHTNLIALGYSNNDNAFWDGSRMTYGDGTYSFSPLTSLDVVAHELGHGVMSSSVNLAYNGESGALNEGFSDIWGASVEAYAAPSKQRWKIGEDISLSGTPLRAMDNPKTGGIQAQPDTYLGTNWVSVSGCSPSSSNDYCGVHTNSGVLNHWYYLLTDGGVGTNDLGRSYSVNGIGISDASKIAYRTITTTLNNAQATFANTRTATIQAAIDLFGTGSCQDIAVQNAWYAVGVGDAPYNLSIVNSSNNNCSTNTFTLNNVPAGSTPSWSVSSGYTINSTSGNSVTLTGGGNATLTASLGTACGTISISKQINLDVPPPVDIYGFVNGSNICGNSTYNAFVDNSYSYYDWTVNGGTIISGQGTGEIHYTTNPYSIYAGNNDFYITCHVKDQCGNWVPQSPIEYGTITDCGPGGGYGDIIFYPNPSNNSFTIGSNPAYNKSQIDILAVKPSFSFKILNSSGKILRQGSSAGEDIIVDTKDIKAGTYFVHIEVLGKKIRKQIIVAH